VPAVEAWIDGHLSRHAGFTVVVVVVVEIAAGRSRSGIIA